MLKEAVYRARRARRAWLLFAARALLEEPPQGRLGGSPVHPRCGGEGRDWILGGQVARGSLWRWRRRTTSRRTHGLEHRLEAGPALLESFIYLAADPGQIREVVHLRQRVAEQAVAVLVLDRAPAAGAEGGIHVFLSTVGVGELSSGGWTRTTDSAIMS